MPARASTAVHMLARRTARAAVFVLVLLLAPALAHAIPIGDFETGFDGWSRSGATNRPTGVSGIAPTSGSRMLQLRTSNGATPNDGTLDAFFGFASGTIDALSPNGAPGTEGSGATLVVSANAGDVLSYDYNFVTDETLADAATFRDFFFSSIRSNEEGEVVREDVLAMTRLATSNPSRFQSGWQSVSYTFLTSGSFTVGFGVVDVQDTAVTSRVLLDNIQLVPEPSSAVLLGVGLLALAARRRA